MKVKIYRTNRKVKQSPFLTACKERDGVLGNIEITHVSNVDDYINDRLYVSSGENLKRGNIYTYGSEWDGIVKELQKPDTFNKLLKFFKKNK